MKWLAEFWDKTWSRKYERYNRHHEAIWRSVMPFVRGRIVDIGCGPAVMWEGKDVDLTGVDWSKEALKQAKLHNSKGVYVQADACATGLPDKTYDTVLMQGLLDYFDNWKPVIAEARRLVKDDGRIFATLLNGFRNHNWFNPQLVEIMLGYKPKRYEHPCGNWILIEI